MGAESERVAQFGRLEDGLLQAGEWYRWGPYVSERQWGTVREDYSADGEAWDYLPHDHARSRAYRWGEDGRPEDPAADIRRVRDGRAGALFGWWCAFTRDLRRERGFTIDDMAIAAYSSQAESAASIPKTPAG